MSRMTRTAWGLDTSDDVHQWRLHAACRNYDPAWWDLVGRKLTAENRKAQTVCRGCTVQVQCLDMGVRTDSWGVILGGREFLGGASGPRKVRVGAGGVA